MSRRRFHALAGSGLLLLALRAVGASDATDALPPWLSAIDRQAVEAIGAAYLAAHPDERDRAELRRRIEREFVARRRTAGAQSAVSVLSALVRNEFREGRVVIVDGWMLSRSEARIYALAVLAAAPQR
ncbi:MAG: hypothetical protein H6945_20865 [Zoogloeaceae bacterium]|nr:hypothetical protein [Rhodocyclaceae bacterium]MCP5238187.1 hypothetical protein [Zoogloeaceae bacterium]